MIVLRAAAGSELKVTPTGVPLIGLAPLTVGAKIPLGVAGAALLMALEPGASLIWGGVVGAAGELPVRTALPARTVPAPALPVPGLPDPALTAPVVAAFACPNASWPATEITDKATYFLIPSFNHSGVRAPRRVSPDWMVGPKPKWAAAMPNFCVDFSSDGVLADQGFQHLTGSRILANHDS